MILIFLLIISILSINTEDSCDVIVRDYDTCIKKGYCEYHISYYDIEQMVNLIIVMGLGLAIIISLPIIFAVIYCWNK